ncbi:MAG: ABC transporter permease [Planctomycetota bacterium]
MMSPRISGLAIALMAITGAMALALLGLWCAGFAPLDVITTWCVGACGSSIRIALSLQEAGPLLLTGLAVATAFRCGVLNIGGEGQFLAGAAGFTAAAVLLPASSLALVIALLFGTMIGAGWAGIAAALAQWRNVPVVLSTILLNIIAVALLGALVEGPLRDPLTSAPQSALLSDAYFLPVLVHGTRLHLGVALAGVLALLIWLVHARSQLGFELLVVGLNPETARRVGIPVSARQMQVLLLSGGFAGLAGAMQVAGVTHFLSAATTSYGYAGIAVALLGRLHPVGIIAAAIFMGMLDTGGRACEKQLGVPHEVGDIIKGLMVLGVLLAAGWAVRRQALMRRREASDA